ncbi:hypothetical protein SPRG_13394 [Saprolegnia parasitica CBS 223.65]|uniref:Uncharacterized protein n=1 Tax=Saprolegnia parasitica (strain CBS 223.65) TaxID=695850 RepID=A0A067C263_SAPPC|nr:hypothetical protein SPRG_13394 [Saprolegnia parasitica CBS 223.65]KDO20641.1 hypothetical protein SPRG_13394 [Saprolegnia parasitica CBS 223.65]|eukprot:XP_012208607.1 hypothetical protein SPRG_13394 [Saprolegnia parasitica CBS 223.65]
MTAATSGVLRSADLFALLASYQDGVIEDVLRFRVFTEADCDRLISGDIATMLLPQLHAVDAALAPWYAAVGTSRLLSVLRDAPPMRYMVLYHAAYADRVDIAGFVHAHYRLESSCDHLLDLAALRGSLATLTFFLANGYSGLTGHALDLAARQGHLHVVEHITDHTDVVGSTRAMDGAASEGHLTVVQYLHARRREGATVAALDGAAANGHLAIVTFLHEKRTYGATRGAIDRAALNGHLDVVRFLVTHRSEGYSARTCEAALAHGHKDVYEYLLTRAS